MGSHVEAFRHAGFKGKATDGAVFKLEKREWVGTADFIIVKAQLLLMVVQLPRDNLWNEAWQGLKRHKRGPGEGQERGGTTVSAVKEDGDCSIGRDEFRHVSVSRQQPMNEQTLSSAWLRRGTFFCHFSESGPRGGYSSQTVGPTWGGSLSLSTQKKTWAWKK